MSNEHEHSLIKLRPSFQILISSNSKSKTLFESSIFNHCILEIIEQRLPLTFDITVKSFIIYYLIVIHGLYLPAIDLNLSYID